MRILIVRPSPNKMSLNTYNLQEVGLAKALIRKGFLCDVMYYCGREMDHVEILDFDDNLKLNILWLHGIGILREGIYPSLKKYAGNYDIIQVGGYVGLTSCWLNRKYPNKTVNYQGPYFYEKNRRYMIQTAVFDRLLLPLQNKKNMIVATKSRLASDFVRSKGINDVTTIGVGLDLDNLLRDAEGSYDHEFVKEIQYKKENNKYLLYIGVLEERRNIPFLLKVFKNINTANPDTRLIIIGKGKTEYVSKCISLINTLGVKDNIIYRESLEQKYMSAVYELSDLFLLPTRYEIFGMVLLEAMYFGLPVITTYNGGSSTLINESNGIIINELNDSVWSKEIEKLLDDELRRKSIGEAAHHTVSNEYTWDTLADKFLEVYEKRLKAN